GDRVVAIAPARTIPLTRRLVPDAGRRASVNTTTKGDTPMNTPLTHADLQHFTGDLERFRHPLARKVIYTPGVQFLAERGHAYWLIDEIALAIASGEVAAAGRS